MLSVEWKCWSWVKVALYESTSCLVSWCLIGVHQCFVSVSQFCSGRVKVSHLWTISCVKDRVWRHVWKPKRPFSTSDEDFYFHFIFWLIHLVGKTQFGKTIFGFLLCVFCPCGRNWQSCHWPWYGISKSSPSPREQVGILKAAWDTETWSLKYQAQHKLCHLEWKQNMGLDSNESR